MQTAPQFGRRLKQYRAEQDLTQEALAERVGCAPQTIRKIESGERRPSREMAERLADVLDLSGDARTVFLKAARELPSQPEPSVPSPVVPTPSFTRPVRRLNVPSYTRPFIGRARELAQLVDLLDTAGCQLVTLIGPGGIGKTRLAVETAVECRPFADGVVWVSLASVSTPAQLIPAIADALGFGFYGADDPAVQLIEFMRDKDLLLVLDNMEQLVDGTQPIVELVTHAPGVKVLVTSRERLNVLGEWVVELSGLPLPGDDLQDIAANEAVALFLERARRVQLGFSPADSDLRNIACICRTVEGMPLGIELAASWVRVLSCEEIQQEINRGFDFLATATRDLPGRHQSLRAVFEHSWQLLTDAERHVLCRLTVFRGGFDRAAAAQIAGASLPVLASLVDKSLLRRASSSRYDLHELVRQYAAAYLNNEPRASAEINDRHATYYAAQLERLIPVLQGYSQSQAMHDISVDLDNIRAAWRWSAANQRIADMQRMLPCLQWFFEFRTWYLEGEVLFREAAEALQTPIAQPHGDAAEQHDRARLVMLGVVLARQGYYAARAGHLADANATLKRSEALLRDQNAVDMLCMTLVYRGFVVYQFGNNEKARDLLEESLAIARARDDQWGVAFALFFLGMVAHARGAYQEARRLYEEDLEVWRAGLNPRGISLCLNYMSTTLHILGEYDEAQRLLHESLELATATHDRWGFGTALNHLGLLAHTQGHYEQARYLFNESLALFTEIGSRWDVARTLNYLGEAASAQREQDAARQAYLGALRTALDARAIPEAVTALTGIAALLANDGEQERALELCVHAMRHPTASKEALEAATRLHAALIGRLSDVQVAAIVERVEGQSFERVAEALAAAPGRQRGGFRRVAA